MCFVNKQVTELTQRLSILRIESMNRVLINARIHFNIARIIIYVTCDLTGIFFQNKYVCIFIHSRDLAT